MSSVCVSSAVCHVQRGNEADLLKRGLPCGAARLLAVEDRDGSGLQTDEALSVRVPLASLESPRPHPGLAKRRSVFCPRVGAGYAF